MAVVKKYNLSGNELEQIELDDGLLQPSANPQMIKDYLVAYRRNQRQWSANTKGRSEVRHSGQKPHPQKGTGRARQGCLAAPQTKTVVEFLKKMNLFKKRVLFIGRGFYEYEVKEVNGEFEVQVIGEVVDREILVRSIRNVPKISFSLLPNVNGYDLMLYQDVILIDSAMDEFKVLLEGKKNDE